MSLPTLQDVLLHEDERLDLNDANAIAQNKKLQAYISLLLGAGGMVFKGFTGALTGLSFALDAVDSIAVDANGDAVTKDAATSLSVTVAANKTIYVHAYKADSETDSDTRRFVDDSTDPATEYGTSTTTRLTYSAGLYVKANNDASPTYASFDATHDFGGSVGVRQLVPIAMFQTDGTGLIGGTYKDARKLWAVEVNGNVPSELPFELTGDALSMTSIRSFLAAIASILLLLGKGESWWSPRTENLIQNSDFAIGDTGNIGDRLLNTSPPTRKSLERFFIHSTSTGSVSGAGYRTAIGRGSSAWETSPVSYMRDVPLRWLKFVHLYGETGGGVEHATLNFGHEVDRRIMSETLGRKLQFWGKFIKEDSLAVSAGLSLRVRVIAGTGTGEDVVSGYTGATTIYDQTYSLDTMATDPTSPTNIGFLTTLPVPANATELAVLFTVSGIPEIDTSVTPAPLAIGVNQMMLAPTTTSFSQAWRRRTNDPEELLYFHQYKTKTGYYTGTSASGTVFFEETIPEMGPSPTVTSTLTSELNATVTSTGTIVTAGSVSRAHVESTASYTASSPFGVVRTTWRADYDL